MEDIVTSVVPKAAQYVVDTTNRQWQYMFCIRKFIKNLKDTMTELTLKRDAIQNRAKEAKRNTEIIEKHVEKWLSDVENLLDEAEKMKQEPEANNKCFHGHCPSRKRYRLCKQMAKKIEEMTKLIKKNEFEPFSHRASLPGIEYESSDGFTYFNSTKEAYDRIMEALKNDNTHTIGLYGMAGAGKTTLATEVGRKAKELNLFDLVIKVTLSQTPNIGKIHEEMADFLNLKFDKYTEEGRKQQLSMRLKEEKRVLIILDDVWKKMELKAIGIDFDPEQKRSCKVLLTTRCYDVCTSMDCQMEILLGLLSEEEAWALFKKYANIEDQYASEILNQPRKVSRECKGLPIAIKTVASSLKGKGVESKVHHWEVALKKLKASIPLYGEGGDAFNCIKLSYDFLENKEGKLLLLMCAMFPEDHEIPVEELIRYGAGLGVCGEFESFDSTRNLIKVGLDTLVDSCLLMRCFGMKNDYHHVQMHDLIRDTALWISSTEERAITVNTEKGLNSLIWNGVAKNCFAVFSWYGDVGEISCQWDAPKLEILMLNIEYSSGLSCTSFDGMKKLKVMAITNKEKFGIPTFSLDEDGFPSLSVSRSISFPSLSLPQSIQSLSNLRTLRLRGWKLSDISFIVSLRKLEVLDLQSCSFKEVPEGIENLNELKLLDLTESDVMENYNFEGIARCPQLEELYISKADICFVNDLASTKLQRYELQFGGNSRRYREDVSSKRILKIEDFDFSTIVGSKQNLFQNAEEVHFYGGHGGFKNVIPDMVRAMLGMNELRMLRLSECEQIECLTDADSFQEDALLPRLVNLQLISLPDLTEVCRGRPVPGLLEKLEKFRISECWNVLNIFPKEGQLCNLKILDLHQCGVVTLFSLSVAASLQQLAELSISECKHLRHIITSEGGEISVAVHNSHSIFPNLKKLYVSCCHNLQFVFPISRVQQGLAQLQEMKINCCSELKYIFGGCDDEHNNSSHDQNEIQIMLPSLQTFQLSFLGNLIGMCPQNCHVSWPSLRVVRWEYCQRLTTRWICSEQHQNVLISLPDSKEVFRGRPVLGLLGKLAELRISKCQNVLNIFPKEAQLCNLKILDLCGCGAVTLFSMSAAASLQQLAELRIKKCENLSHIITSGGHEISVALHNSHSIFPNLKKLDVCKCHKLQYVFPISCGEEGLAQLQEIKIYYCNELEYVFGPHDHEQNNSSHDRNEIQIMLPSLHLFELNYLGNLTGMCPQNCQASWPSLRKIYWYGCPRFTASWICSEQRQNVGVASADDHIKHFVSKLESLWSSGLSELKLICINPQILSFQYLQSLDVKDCSRQKYIFPRAIQINLPELTSLSITGCDELEEIIANNVEEPQNHSNAQVYLPKLKKLYIFHCSKLKSLFSFAMAETLPQLQSLCVQECAQLKEIFRCTANEEKIVLPNLSSITLQRLPRLVDICQGFVLHTLMQLQRLSMQGCPNFSLGATQVVPLDYITEEVVILWEINTSSNQLSQQQILPLALQSFLNIKFVILQDSCGVELAGILKIKVEGVLHVAQNSLYSNLQWLCLINLPKLRFIWSDPISILGFHELEDVYVEGCSKLKTIFPPGIVGSLQNLKSLYISNCEELEDIVIMPPDLKVICLPKLRKIEVNKCHKLKCLVSASMGCDFPQLHSLNIKECNKLKCLFSGSVMCNLPELYYIKIQECSELERVFHFKPVEVVDDENSDRHGERQLALPRLKELKLEGLPNFTEVEKLNMQVRQSYY